MKHRILNSLFFVFLVSLALALVLAACGGEPGGTVSPIASSQQPEGGGPSPQIQPSAAQPAGIGLPVETEPAVPDESPALPSDAPALPDNTPAGAPESPAPALPLTMEGAYRAALEAIYNDHRYPNGDEVATGDGYQMEDNDFAIFDVDGDGKDELIYQNDNSYMAGMITTIYGFDPDTGKLYQELSGFVAMEFHDNGVVSIMASHNHGLSALEDFWPYAIYQYDPGSDGYLMAGSLDAWDGTLFPKDYDGDSFPADIDQDGDQVVYILTTPGAEVTKTVIDGPAYREWVDSYLAGASELELPWKNMTPENIRAVAP